MATRNVKKISIKDKSGVLNSFDLSNYAKNVDASLTQKGITMLQTNIDDTETKAATPKAVNTVKTLADSNTQEIEKLKAAIGEDGSGTAFENVAYTNKSNEFTQSQKITVDGKSLNIGTDTLYGENAVTPDDVLKVGIKDTTGIKAEISIGANGSIKRTELPEEPTDLELATIKYVNDKSSEIAENIKDATLEQKGITMLQTTIDNTETKAATPKAVKTVQDEVNSLKNELSAINSGQRTLAYKDYTQTPNQELMKSGIYYLVPFNKSNQFLEFDPETGKPKTTQADGVTDTKVDHFVIMYKAVGSNIVANLGEQDVQPNFDLFARLNGDNTFSGDNTFNNSPKKVNQSSSTSDLSDLEDGDLLSKKEVVDYTAAITEGLIPKVVTEAEAPTEETAEENVIYFVVEDSPVP